MVCGLWSSFLPSAPLSWGSASNGLAVQPALSLTDGRGGPRLTELAFAAGQATLHDKATHEAGLDFLKVVRLCADFRLQEADVRLIPSLLLRERGGKIRPKEDKTRGEFPDLTVILRSYICNLNVFLATNKTTTNDNVIKK